MVHHCQRWLWKPKRLIEKAIWGLTGEHPKYPCPSKRITSGVQVQKSIFFVFELRAQCLSVRDVGLDPEEQS
jgi:hypothetical protein